MAQKECLSNQDLEAFVQNRAGTEKQTVWKRHLRVCDDCALRLAELRSRQVSLAGTDKDPDSPRSPFIEHLAFSALEPNIQFGDFRIEKRLGCGGMGVVYRAHQISLNRRVALKVLHFDFTADLSAIKRFHREAQAAAKLHHPNIIAVHSVGEKDGICYYVMDLIEGQTLDAIIKDRQGRRSFIKEPPSLQNECTSAPESSGQDPPDHNEGSVVSEILTKNKPNKLYFDTVAALVAEVADSLQYAHSRGVIHRDVKPANIMLNEKGRPILMDFGIARLTEAQSLKFTNSYVGTPQYMSPEQVTGSRFQLDQRTDIYSLGATLYELLTLKSLLKPSDSREGILYQILHENPRRPHQIDSRIPIDLETICIKAIEKDADCRYQSASELADDLRRYLNGQPIQAKPPGPVDKTVKFVRRYRLAVSLFAVIVLIALTTGLVSRKYFRTRWVHRQAIPRIEQKIKAFNFIDAFVLMQKAEKFLPDDPLLKELWPKLSKSCTIITDPPGARVLCHQYYTKGDTVIDFGHAPLKNIRLPFGTHRWQIEKDGYQTVECTRSVNIPKPYHPDDASERTLQFTLHQQGVFPSDMAWVPPSELKQYMLFHVDKTIPSSSPFLIDKYEVTNRQFKEFVDQNGYENPDYWDQEFVKDGVVLSREQAMQYFRDQTGLPGPACWANGTYPEDEADFPVGGVSWYEAMAYARFRNKDLPTVFHWREAAMDGEGPTRICSLSNFGASPAAVGTFKGISPFGLFDIAGNVREWCSNSLQNQPQSRCILGGAWGENEYMFAMGVARSCWDRDPKNGFRCVRYLDPKASTPPEAFEPLECKFRDFSHFTPVSDQEFSIWLNTLYTYDHTPLDAQIESVNNDLEYCRREKITFDAAYSSDRVLVDLLLPRHSMGPYQAAIWFPGAGSLSRDWNEQRDLKPVIIEMIKSGRAVVIPHYYATYSRHLEELPPMTSVQYRDMYLKISKDLHRTIDYMETRHDIDVNKLAYVGSSWGGWGGTIMIATEPRFKVGILLHGGICACRRHPVTDPANFAPRVTIPILMVNGRDDPLFPYEQAQKPLFDLLGTPPSQKKHVLLPGSHTILWEYRNSFRKEVVDWLDLWLGPTVRYESDHKAIH